MTKKIKELTKSKQLEPLQEQYRRYSEKLMKLWDKDGQEYFCHMEQIRNIEVDGWERLVVVGTDTSLLPRKAIQFNEGIAEEICDKLIEGKTLTAICKEEYMPGMTTIHKWARRNDIFAEQMDQALRLSAYANLDRVQELSEGEEMDTDTDIKRAQMQQSALKWLTEKKNPERFGPSMKVKNEGGPEIVVVNTGISRETIEVDSKKKLTENDN